MASPERVLLAAALRATMQQVANGSGLLIVSAVAVPPAADSGGEQRGRGGAGGVREVLRMNLNETLARPTVHVVAKGGGDGVLFRAWERPEEAAAAEAEGVGMLCLALHWVLWKRTALRCCAGGRCGRGSSSRDGGRRGRVDV